MLRRSRLSYPIAIVLLAACGGGGAGPATAHATLSFDEIHPEDGWLELVNDGETECPTSGMRLEILDGGGRSLALPASVVSPGARVVVTDPAGLPAPGVAVLRARDGSLLERASWPGLPPGEVSYVRTPSGWRASDLPTRAAPGPAAPHPLRLNEVLPRGADGAAWVEVVNAGPGDVSLAGLGLTDDPAAPFRWSFPPGPVLEDGDRLLVRFDEVPDGPEGLRASFALPPEGGSLLLFAPDGRLVDAVACRELPTDVSCGRAKDGAADWIEFSEATPGGSNKKGRIRALDDPAHAEGAPDYGRVFDLSRVRTIEIEMDETELARLEDDLARNAPLPATERDFRYFDGRVRFGGDVWEHVGVRYKGSSSVAPWFAGRGKISLKLDFDEFEDVWPETRNQRFWGLKKLNLSNSWSDPSMLREMLCLELMRAVGAPASRCSPWRVVVNGVYRGLFIAVEQIDERFLADRFGNDEGNLYKPDGPGADLTGFVESSFEKKTNEDEEDWSDVEELIRALADPSANPTTFVEVETFLRWLAVSTAVVNLDSYQAKPRNYYLYSDPDLGKFRFITWDHNLAFGRLLLVDQDLDADNVHLFDPDRPWIGDRPLIERVLAVPAHGERYREILAGLLDGPFSEEVLDVRARELHDLIRPHVIGPDGERFPYTLLERPEDFDRNLTDSVPATGRLRALGVLEFLSRRRAALR